MSDTKEILRMLRDEPNWNPSFGPGGLSRHEAKVWHETCVKAADEIERLEAENFKLHERACSAENELSDKNKRIKDLRNVIANHKDRLTVAAIDLEDDLIEANLGVNPRKKIKQALKD